MILTERSELDCENRRSPAVTFARHSGAGNRALFLAVVDVLEAAGVCGQGCSVDGLQFLVRAAHARVAKRGVTTARSEREMLRVCDRAIGSCPGAVKLACAPRTACWRCERRERPALVSVRVIVLIAGAVNLTAPVASGSGLGGRRPGVDLDRRYHLMRARPGLSDSNEIDKGWWRSIVSPVSSGVTAARSRDLTRALVGIGVPTSTRFPSVARHSDTSGHDLAL